MTDPLQRLARETAEKILLQGRDVSMTMDEWKRHRPDLAKDLDEEVAALTPIILAALRQAQQEERERCAQIVEAEAMKVKSPFSRAYNQAIRDCAATLRSQEIP